ncbi:hypothetical protein JR316_0009261 [Psilocybe cubensis]|uniref:Uncharacterized protein n=2 Tax=Psilocybe cubensis TaxID=181762 RepID=A0ACB8GTK1_PSICU|nr:hypothetical protein JR316_0009261 [Psilocybe cubensis]KAH9478800.1 hypothetical protein JR316_0009261 [Psilocybe cubensis]
MSSIQEEKDSINHSPIHIEKQSNTRSNSLPNLPSKLWDIKDTFKYAPPKPEGDAWALLLDPLIKKDRVQCDAWKDEVQNLLIFAGLFSAVVTTFIAESYKNLQADPNDTIVGLLSQIASQTDRSLNTTTVKWEPANSFVPTSSSIRVNVFWFISLVLSLATVVIGIVSLQWLREHQAYESDLSSREKYALYNMRADGIKKWHVDKIFTSLPLLLQSALVLFLGGIIDFLHAIGYWAVTIPVAVVISFILLFLIATTLLPCLQVLSLYVYFPRRNGTVPKFVAPPTPSTPIKRPTPAFFVNKIFSPLLELMKYYLREENGLRNAKLGEQKIPECFKIQGGYYSLSLESPDALEFSLQFGEVALLMLRRLETYGNIKETTLSASSIQQHQLADFMSLIGVLSSQRKFILGRMQKDSRQPATEPDIFTSILSFLEEHLTSKVLEMMSAPASSDQHHHPSLLFYLAALYCESVMIDDLRQCKSLLAALCIYKELTIDKGLSDPAIEAALSARRVSFWLDIGEPFSEGWWDHFMGQVQKASAELGVDDPESTGQYGFA